MTHELVTGSDIATALGVDSSTVWRRAQNEGWQFEDRPGAGGRVRHYQVTSLPQSIVDAVAAHRLRANASVEAMVEASCSDALDAQIAVRRQNAAAELAKVSDVQRRRALTKLSILEACDTFISQMGLTRKDGTPRFCAVFNMGAVRLKADLAGEITTTNPDTIRDWRRKLAREGVVALAGVAYGKHRKGIGQIDGDQEVKDLILGMLAAKPHATTIDIRNAIMTRLGLNSARVPGLTKLGRWVKKWKDENRQVHMALTNPDAWRSKYMAASGSASEGILSPNQRWEFDSTPADLRLKNGTRAAIIGAIDVYTRRMKLHVARTSSAAGVASLIRKCLIDWGVPKAIKVDNGRDYTSDHVTTLLRDLGIERELCTPFNPQLKPHIERAFGTFSHGILKLLPGYTGHNVAEAQAIRARVSFAARRAEASEEPLELNMTAEELQSYCDRWCNVYAHEVHGGLAGKTPAQMIQAWARPILKIENERALDILLMPAAKDGGWRVVGKKGIKAEGCLYDHAMLGGYEGKRVFMRIDPEDIGTAYVFDDDKNFICMAVDPEVAGVSRAEIAAGRKANQVRDVMSQRKEMKENARRLKLKDIGIEILESKEKRIAAAQANVTHFPKRTNEHTTDAIAAAGDAAAAADTPKPTRARQRKVANGPTLTGEAVFTGEVKESQFIDEFKRSTGLDAFVDAVPLDRSRFKKFLPR